MCGPEFRRKISLTNVTSCATGGATNTVGLLFYLVEMFGRVRVCYWGFAAVTTVTLHTAVMCLFPDEYKSELGQQLSLIAGSLVGGVCIVSLIAIAIICARYGHTEANAMQTGMAGIHVYIYICSILALYCVTAMREQRGFSASNCSHRSQVGFTFSRI